MSRFITFALAALLLIGCRPKQPAASATSAQASATTTAAATTSGSAAKPTDEPPPEAEPDDAELGPPCIDDRSCQEYLRCEDGHCAVPPAVDGRHIDGMPTATFHDGDRELATIHLEIADENHERTRGLMYRRRMHPDFGMLFIFDQDRERSFWMKNTLIPLDMVHIDSRGEVVGIVANAEPMTLSPRQTGKPARYVLELVAGRAAELGIEPGTRMSVTGVPADQAPSRE